METFTPEKSANAANQAVFPQIAGCETHTKALSELLLLPFSSHLCFILWPKLYFLSENLLLHRPPSHLISQHSFDTLLISPMSYHVIPDLAVSPFPETRGGVGGWGRGSWRPVLFCDLLETPVKFHIMLQLLCSNIFHFY